MKLLLRSYFLNVYTPCTDRKVANGSGSTIYRQSPVKTPDLKTLAKTYTTTAREPSIYESTESDKLISIKHYIVVIQMLHF